MSNAMLSPISDISYVSTSVTLPSLTAWIDLAKYLRVWCSLHDYSDNIAAVYYLEEGVVTRDSALRVL